MHHTTHESAELSAALAKLLGMANHPNRSKASPSMAANPTPEAIRAAREAAGLTQTEAASVVYSSLRTWQNWEAPKDAPEHRRMHPAIWELWLLKTETRRGQ